MAKGSNSTSGPGVPVAPEGAADDAFATRVLLFVAWAQKNTQTLVIAAVAVAALVGGSIWFIAQRSGTLAQASTQFEQVQQVAASAAPEEAVAEVERFLTTFGKTPYGLEARLLLGEIHLENGNVDGAIEALTPVAPSFGDPLRVQATFLLAVAYEQGERWDQAATLYRDLSRRAEMSFQKREATEGLSRALIAQGDVPGAVAALDLLIAEYEEGAPARGYFEMRRQELLASTR